MLASVPVPESQWCRARALECRVTAQLFRVDFARDQMLKAAADFDGIAREAREREIAEGISHLGKLVHDLHFAASPENGEVSRESTEIRDTRPSL
jgi:hypothetical protein